MNISIKRNKNYRITIIYLLVCLMLVGFALISVSIGTVHVSLSELVRILFHNDTSDITGKIIMQIRVPRVIAAFFLGGALALSGFLLQTFFNNPIAGPFVLGISSGAKLCVAVFMVMSLKLARTLNGNMLVIAALIGSLVATSFVIAVSARVKNMAILIVCGVMIGYICSAVTDLIVTFADDANIVNLHNWSLGSFAAIDMKDAVNYIPIIIAGFILAMILSKAMESYLFGEDYAKSIGVNTRLFRIVLIVLSSILSAVVTAFAGPISFVGIAVPHIMRVLLKNNKPRVLIPAIFLAGALFCIASDIIARCIFAPTELSISTVTAVFGAPVVISLLLKRKAGK